MTVNDILSMQEMFNNAEALYNEGDYVNGLREFTKV